MAEGPLVHDYARRFRPVLRGKEGSLEFGVCKLKQSEPLLRAIRVQDAS